MYQQPPPPYAYPPGGYGYPQPPPNYRFSSATPSPRGSAQKTRHSRSTSQQVPPGYAYSPRGGPQFADPRYSTYSSPLRGPEFVSDFDYYGQSRYRVPSYDRPRSSKQSRENARFREHQRFGSFYPSFTPDDVFGDDYYGGTPPPPYEDHHKFAAADYSYYYYQNRERANQTAFQPQRDGPTPMPMPKANQSRPRRASTAAGQRPPQERPQTTPPKPKAQPQKRKATEEDRLRCGIPAGYSLKNWDPTEEPIMVLGSVFDANSLGKWIYDWACYAYGTDKPLTDMAAELWLLLIHLAGKYKRADEVIDRVRVDSKREMVEDFLESGERLWVRFRKLLKVCEDYMWKAAQRETGEKKPANMGAKSGVAFVKCLFGRDCELDKTEKLMANIRLFSIRFEVNIEPIIRSPEAEESEVGESDDEA
ncbi:hypothetical protein BT63DRAFT_289853 [Microthyrium microscopicum]|uniref:Vegetative cell wall protein gp1 n=1 Tax=Microthyrium microscopicum TaxID=703497 RepID=A0A6A6U8U3_9PEZI|nr:hypothetical protein BT63DRAFT_289853 [Microthyrium microscopicum]